MPHSEWFNQARYGAFIHWGAYSATARGEWVMNRERIPPEEYRAEYAENFRAAKFDAADWAGKIKRWGMGYAVLTTRHHDGFALWDSSMNPFNAARVGARRDLVAEYARAMREAGLKVGFYYSPANWSHPDYPGPFFRDWPGAKDWKDAAARERFIAYYRAELEELLTRYGKIDYLWFDGCIPGDIGGDETIARIRELQPDALINDRLGKPYDVKVCEQAINPPRGEDTDWEACMTLNGNWGFHAGDRRWKSAEDVVALLLECAKDGGNLLLNIGPDSDGVIPAESEKILDTAGRWFAANSEAVRGSQRHPFSWNNTSQITRRANRVYLTFINDPGGRFRWAELRGRVLRAFWLDDNSEVAFTQSGDGILTLKNLCHRAPARTLALECEDEPQALTTKTSFWIPG